MADNDPRVLDVLVAEYNNVRDAEADMQSLQTLYQSLGTSYNFDAAVIHKDQKGKVRIDKTVEAGRLHEALKGLGFGLAAGLVAAIFPPIGIGAALVAGGVGGAAIGAVVGHMQSGIPREELKKLADELDHSTAALIVVYETSLKEQIKRNIKAVKQVISKVADVKKDEIAEEIRQARTA